MLGSFERTGNYPMESNYIFANEQALNTFYNDDINKATIHAGLFRIILDDGDGKQALYWAYTDENNELKFKKIVSTDTIEELKQQIENLSDAIDEETEKREDYDEALQELADEMQSQLDDLREILNNTISDLQAVVGTQDPIQQYLQTLPYENLTEIAQALNKFLNTTDSTDDSINTLPELQSFLNGYTDSDTLSGLIQDTLNTIYGSPLPTESFRTLRGIEDFVRAFQSQSINADAQLHTELDQTQVGAGLNGDGSYQATVGTNYIDNATSIMDAVRLLDAQIHTAISNYNISTSNNDVINLSISREADRQVISGRLVISPQNGNQLVKKADGLYYNANVTYNQGTVTFSVNDNIISQFNIALGSIVQDAYYDSNTEDIVIIFNLQNGTQQTIRIGAGTLIREWSVLNDQTSPIVLTKTNVTGAGPDTLSASVKISDDSDNILQIDSGELLVEGIAENIRYEQTTVKGIIAEILQSQSTTNTNVTNLGTRVSAVESNLATLTERVTTNKTVTDQAIDNLEAKHDTDIARLEDEWEDSFETFEAEVNNALLDMRQSINWEEYQ